MLRIYLTDIVIRGFLDLVDIFGGCLGDTQLKSLCVISSLSLLATVGVTSAAVSERIQLTRYGEKKKSIWAQVYNVFLRLYQAVRTLPRRVALIFYIQLCSWYGWFLFLFYSSTWVGEVYSKYSVVASEEPNNSNQKSDTVGDIARVGSLSLTVFSLVSLVFSLLLPEILQRLNNISTEDMGNFQGTSSFSRNPITRKLRQGVRLLVRPFQKFILKLSTGDFFIGKVDLTLFWLLSQIIYALASFSMLYVRSVEQATVVVGIFGVCWSITTWAPFSLLAEEVLLIGQKQGSNISNTTSILHPKKYDDSDRSSLHTRGSRAQDIEMISMFNEARGSTDSVAPSINSVRHARSSSIETIELHIAQPEFDEKDQLSPKRKKHYPNLGNDSRTPSRSGSDRLINYSSANPNHHSLYHHHRHSSVTEDDFYSDGTDIISTTGEHSGVYLGLHNVAITVPQLLSTFVSFLVFSTFETPGNNISDATTKDLTENTNGDGGLAIALTMQLGGIAALISLYFLVKLRQES